MVRTIVSKEDHTSDGIWNFTWEETACPMCAARDAAPILESADPTPETGGLWFAVVQCRRCGLCYTNPRPAPDSIGRFYPQAYRPHGRPLSERPLRKWYPLRALQRSGRRCPERRSLPMHGRGRLLDFGCGGGSFLQRMAEQGWNVVGMDLSPTAVERVRTELKLPALLGTLPHPDLTPGSFDVITMWHSLEHVHQPLVTLRHAYELLAPQGRLFVAVPNIESWPFRWFGRSWFALDLPRHLTHFAPDTLTAMLESSGFRVQALRWIRHSDWLRSSACLAIRQANPTVPFWAKWLRYKPLARLAAWACYLCRQSDTMLAIAERP